MALPKGESAGMRATSTGYVLGVSVSRIDDSEMTAHPPADGAAPEGATKHTAIGVGLNLLLLCMIGYGYWRSEDWKWAWVLVGVPITVVTIRYAWHLMTSRS